MICKLIIHNRNFIWYKQFRQISTRRNRIKRDHFLKVQNDLQLVNSLMLKKLSDFYGIFLSCCLIICISRTVPRTVRLKYSKRFWCQRICNHGLIFENIIAIRSVVVVVVGFFGSIKKVLAMVNHWLFHD